MRALRTQALGLAICSLVTSARAQSPPLKVSWSAPESCPQQPAFTTQLEGFLGRELAALDDPSLDVVGNVRADAAKGYVARLRVRTKLGSQQRELAHRDCAELTEAAALVSALAIDPNLVVSSPKAGDEPAEVSPVPTPPPPVDARPATPAEPPSAPSAPSRDAPHPVRPSRSLHPSVAALGLVGSSVLPGAGAGVGLFGALGLGRFRLAARGNFWFPRFQGVAGVSGPGIDLGAWGVGLKACGLPLAGEVTLAACFGPELGDMYGTGNTQLTNPSTVHNRWSAVSAELALAIKSSSGLTTLFGLELGKTLEAPIYGVRVDGQDVEVFEAHAWPLNAYVGLGLFH
jgi:hypothetical protein